MSTLSATRLLSSITLNKAYCSSILGLYQTIRYLLSVTNLPVNALCTSLESCNLAARYIPPHLFLHFSVNNSICIFFCTHFFNMSHLPLTFCLSSPINSFGTKRQENCCFLSHGSRNLWKWHHFSVVVKPGKCDNFVWL